METRAVTSMPADQVCALASQSNELAQIELPPITNFAEVPQRISY
jgi:hypothetical protein